MKFDPLHIDLYKQSREGYFLVKDAIAKFIVHEIIVKYLGDKTRLNILFIGVHSGEFDVNPLLEELKTKNICNDKINITTIDIVDNFKDTYSFGVNKVIADIELFKLQTKVYDIIISNFTLNHLTNWLRVLQNINESLAQCGVFLTLEYCDPKIQAIEKVLTENNDFKSVIDFHKEKEKSHGVYLDLKLKGSNIKILTSYFDSIPKKIEFPYNYVFEGNFLRERIFCRDVQHSTIRWGLTDAEFEVLTSNIQANGKSIQVKGKLILYIFSKND